MAAVNLDLVHPLTGPVYVDGAKRGDALAVTVVDIAPDNFGSRRSCRVRILPDMFRDPYIVHSEWTASKRVEGLAGDRRSHERVHGYRWRVAGQARLDSRSAREALADAGGAH